jgi:hypothetical protein
MTGTMPILRPDHPLYTDAIDALKRYHEALACGGPIHKIERLRQIAESQLQSVTDY